MDHLTEMPDTSNMTTRELGLSNRVVEALEAGEAQVHVGKTVQLESISTVEELRTYSARELMLRLGIKGDAISEIRRQLHAIGLFLRGEEPQ